MSIVAAVNSLRDAEAFIDRKNYQAAAQRLDVGIDLATQARESLGPFLPSEEAELLPSDEDEYDEE